VEWFVRANFLFKLHCFADESYITVVKIFTIIKDDFYETIVYRNVPPKSEKGKLCDSGTAAEDKLAHKRRRKELEKNICIAREGKRYSIGLCSVSIYTLLLL
jgi:hypothetical protein